MESQSEPKIYTYNRVLYKYVPAKSREEEHGGYRTDIHYEQEYLVGVYDKTEKIYDKDLIHKIMYENLTSAPEDMTSAKTFDEINAETKLNDSLKKTILQNEYFAFDPTIDLTNVSTLYFLEKPEWIKERDVEGNFSMKGPFNSDNIGRVQDYTSTHDIFYRPSGGIITSLFRSGKNSYNSLSGNDWRMHFPLKGGRNNKKTKKIRPKKSKKTKKSKKIQKTKKTRKSNKTKKSKKSKK